MQFKLKSGAMFDTDNPCCPTCGGEMWDNRENKKNPKHPDYRCKDENCKDESGFRTGVYLPKAKGNAPAKPANKPAAPAAKPATPAPAATPSPTAPQRTSGGKQDYGNNVPPSMYGAWAMNLVVALVGQGKVTSVAEGITAYSEALRGVGQAIENNKIILDAKTPIPPAQQEKQVAKPVPAPATPAPTAKAAEETEPLPDPLAQIEQDLGGAGMGEISAEDLSNLDL